MCGFEHPPRPPELFPTIGGSDSLVMAMSIVPKMGVARSTGKDGTAKGKKYLHPKMARLHGVVIGRWGDHKVTVLGRSTNKEIRTKAI